METHATAARAWTCDNLEAAGAQANHAARPCGHHGPTPRDGSQARPPLTQDQHRCEFRQRAFDMELSVKQELEIENQCLNPYARAAEARAAIQRALERLDYLPVMRKRITPAFPP